MLKLTFLLTILICFPVIADDELPWVSIQIEEVQNQRMVEYYGQVSEETLAAILNGKPSQLFFRLQSVFWYDDLGRTVKFSQLKSDSLPYGYSDEAYFRFNDVKRVVPLESSVVLANFERKTLDIKDVKTPDTLQCSVNTCMHTLLEQLIQ